MRTQVKKWGNSASVRIPASIMQAACLELDQDVEIWEEDGRVIVLPLRQPVFSLESLLNDITDDNLHGEVDTGMPRGGEIW